MLFLDKQICIFDLEYTDMALAETEGNLPYIVEVGAIKIDRELNILDTFHSLVCPPSEQYSEYSENLCGITKDQLEVSPDWKEIGKLFSKFTGFNRCRLSSWGTYADIPVLKQAYGYYGMGYPHNVVPLDAITVTSVVASFSNIKLKSLALKNVALTFGIPVSVSHRALEDCHTVLKIFKELNKMEISGEDKFELLEF